jgi:hypothetical protein
MKRGASAESPKASRSRFTAFVEPVVEIDEGLGRPQPLPDFFPRDELTRMLQEHVKSLEGLARKTHVCPIASELARTQVRLELTELSDR